MRGFLTAGILLLSPALALAVQASQGAPESPTTIHPAPQALDAYVGSYQLAPHFALKIFRHGNQLYAQATGQGAAPIYPSARDEFYYKIVNAKISFTRNADDKVTGLVLQQNGDHPAPRITNSSAAVTQAPTNMTTWIAMAAVGARTLPITVRRDGFALRGVLDLPDGNGPFGVIDIIPGSGPSTSTATPAASPTVPTENSPRRW